MGITMERNDCTNCHRTFDALGPRGLCGVCLDARVCPDCGEHFNAALGPCSCVTERNELAEARRDADRAHFDAAHLALDAAVAA